MAVSKQLFKDISLGVIRMKGVVNGMISCSHGTALCCLIHIRNFLCTPYGCTKNTAIESSNFRSQITAFQIH